MLVLLEHVSPIERAAYVLREAFDQPYRQISKLLAISEADDRRLDSAERRASISAANRGRQVSAAQHQRFVDVRDLTTLEGVLAADVVASVPGTVAP